MGKTCNHACLPSRQKHPVTGPLARQQMWADRSDTLFGWNCS